MYNQGQGGQNNFPICPLTFVDIFQGLIGGSTAGYVESGCLVSCGAGVRLFLEPGSDRAVTQNHAKDPERPCADYAQWYTAILVGRLPHSISLISDCEATQILLTAFGMTDKEEDREFVLSPFHFQYAGKGTFARNLTGCSQKLQVAHGLKLGQDCNVLITLYELFAGLEGQAFCDSI